MVTYLYSLKNSSTTTKVLIDKGLVTTLVFKKENKIKNLVFKFVKIWLEACYDNDNDIEFI
jgi:hypothetical protein